MFQAKDFYELTGLKRSTVRYYQKEGLLAPTQVGDNGYAYYDDRALIDAMLLKKYRCLDFGMKEVPALSRQDLGTQIKQMDDTCREYEELIGHLERKIKAIQMRSEVLKQCCQVGQMLYDPVGREMEDFYIKETLAAHPVEAREEIVHCVNSFPFVNISGRGRMEELAERGEINFEPGYVFTRSQGFYQPLHPELYANNENGPCILIRLRIRDPLCVAAGDLAPLLEEMKEKELTATGAVYSCISAAEREGEEMFYYVSVRVHVK